MRQVGKLTIPLQIDYPQFAYLLFYFQLQTAFAVFVKCSLGHPECKFATVYKGFHGGNNWRPLANGINLKIIHFKVIVVVTCLVLVVSTDYVHTVSALKLNR